MEIKGTYKFAAPPQAVWDAMHNPAVLQKCIPGVEDVAWKGDSAIVAEVSGIGPLKGPYSGEVQVTESTAPSHMKVSLERVSIGGAVTIDLAAEGPGTLLTYNASVRLDGVLTMLDNPVTRPLVDSQVNHFFSRMDSEIS